MKTLSAFGCFLVVTLLAISFTAGAVLYVRTDGNDGNPGIDWVNAKQTVQAAIDVALEGDEIWVAAGVYEEHLQNRLDGELAVNVELYGGFAGNETLREERDFTTHLTVLDGTDTGTVLTIQGQAGHGTRIDGFVIRAGYSQFSSGGGIRLVVASPVIANNYITSNYAGGGVGGGISSFGHETIGPVQAIITKNIFVLNRSSDGGSGIGLVGASPEISYNTFVRNYTAGSGGGIGCWTSNSAKICSPDVINNFFYENGANYLLGGALGGGGIYATSDAVDGTPVAFGISAPLIANNIIAANNAMTAGGLALVNSNIESATVTNNTIFANHGSGIYWGGTNPAITNNLVAYNSHGMEQFAAGPSSAALRFNNVFGNALQEESTDYINVPDVTGIDGNISLEPRMTLYGKGKYWIQPDSPCIDAGDDSVVDPAWVDIDGQLRIQGLHVDIGAHESDGTLRDASIPVVYVRPDGDDLQDGASWATAKETVPEGVNTAYLIQGDVWVAEGEYMRPTTPEPAPFSLPAFVGLYGGFDGTETEFSQRDVASHPTVLDGGTEPTVVLSSLSGYLVSTLDGFTVQNGGIYTGGSGAASLPGQGGGINVNVSSPFLENNLIRHNSLGNPLNPGYLAEGAGISLTGSFAIIRNNTIRDNEIIAWDGGGGAIYALFSQPIIEGNTITMNHAPRGSAIYSMTSKPRIIGNLIDQNSGWVVYTLFGSSYGAIEMSMCDDFLVESNMIVGNIASVGAGITVQSTSAGRIFGNLFHDNQAYDYSSSNGGMGGGVYVHTMLYPDDDIKIVNNTFSDNHATHSFYGERGGGIAIIASSDRLIIANNVIAFNSSGIYQEPTTIGYVPDLATNCMHNGSDDYVNLLPGPSDMITDPMFVDHAADDYHLQISSPLVDAGTNSAAAGILLDLDGAPRVQDGDYTGGEIVDVGVYEYSPDFDGDGNADWLDPDDDDDGVDDLSDCAPLNDQVWSFPEEVAGLALTHDTATHLTWVAQDPGTAFDVCGDTIAQLLADGGILAASCLEHEFPSPAWDDESPDPPAGTGIYYVIRGRNVCGTGTYGQDSSGGDRVNTACP